MTAPAGPDPVVLDIRPVDEFTRGHPAGALFVEFDRRIFLPLVRLFVPPGAPLTLVAPDPGTAAAARPLLEEAGHPVRAVLVGGDGLAAAGHRLEALPTVTVDGLADRLAAPARDFRLLDVRQRFEWALGRIEGAELVPLKTLAQAAAGWPAAGEVLCVCEQGVRSATAVSVLRRRGFTRVGNVAGGVAAWAAAGRPLEED